jgi:1,2-phenylacetyl-CoA epoxidase catalytic subunit
VNGGKTRSGENYTPQHSQSSSQYRIQESTKEQFLQRWRERHAEERQQISLTCSLEKLIHGQVLGNWQKPRKGLKSDCKRDAREHIH